MRGQHLGETDKALGNRAGNLIFEQIEFLFVEDGDCLDLDQVIGIGKPGNL